MKCDQCCPLKQEIDDFMLDLSALRLTRLLFKEVSRTEKAQPIKGGYHAWNHSSLKLLPVFKMYIYYQHSMSRTEKG